MVLHAGWPLSGSLVSSLIKIGSVVTEILGVKIWVPAYFGQWLSPVLPYRHRRDLEVI